MFRGFLFLLVCKFSLIILISPLSLLLIAFSYKLTDEDQGQVCDVPICVKEWAPS